MKLFDFNKQAIGLDISLDSIKLVKLKKMGDSITLLNMDMEKIASEPIGEETEDVRYELTVNAIKRLLTKNKIENNKIYTSVSGPSIVVRYIKVPVMKEMELKDAIRFEIEDHIPFDMDHIIMDFQIIKEIEEKEEKMMLTLVVVAKEDLINGHIELLRGTNLETVHINVDSFAAEDTWEYYDGVGEAVALIDIGARMTNLNIIENKMSIFNRDILIGSNDITDVIRREFGLSFQEAETLKEEEGLILWHEEDVIEKEDMKKEPLNVLENIGLGPEVTIPLPTTFSPAEFRPEGYTPAGGPASIISGLEHLLSPISYDEPPKKSRPPLSEEDAKKERISSAIEPIISKLLEEIERSFAYYYTQLPVYRKNIERIILSGGTANLTNLDKFLERGLNIPVEIANPFKKIKVSSKIDPIFLNKNAPLYMVAIGLALRGL